VNDVAHVSLGFLTRLGIRSQNFAKEFFTLLHKYDGDLVPYEFDGGRLTGHQWVRFDETTFDLAVDVWGQLGNLVMRRQEPMESEITVNMHFAARGAFNTASVSVEEPFFTVSGRVASFLDLSLALYDLLQPAYGAIHNVEDKLETRTVMDPKYGRTVIPTNLKKGLPGIYWANFLGPEYVAMLSRERLMSAPCFRIQDLPDGGMLILTSQTPLDPSSPDNRDAQRKVRQYLGEDIFYPSEVTSMRVPEFRFSSSPSSADQGVLIVSKSDLEKKRANSQNFIENAQDLATLLREELAEQGVDLDQSLNSLHALDQVLLQKRETREALDEFSASMYAAYAGEVAIRAFNGNWVVEETTGEVALQIKDNRVFPVVRVFKFWESEEKDVFSTIFDILGVLTENQAIGRPERDRSEESLL